MVEPTACRTCGGHGLRNLGACPVVDDEVPDHLYLCDDCGLGQRHPIPDAAGIAAMYAGIGVEEMDYGHDGTAAWALAKKELATRFPGETRVSVLDVGCHTGAFLAGLPAQWERHGIEGMGAPRAFAESSHAVRMIGERIEDVATEWDGHFDVVTLFDVVEHLPDPGTGIEAALRLVKPGGLLMFSTADLDAWTWRWLGAGHWYLQTPQHLSVLSRKFLHYLAQRSHARLSGVRRIPHRDDTASVRMHEAIRAFYWGARQRRSVWRLPHRLLQSVPGLRQLRNMTSVPWTMALHDHFLCSYERLEPKQP